MRMNSEWENRFIYGKFEKDKLINMYLPSELFQNLHTGSTQKIYMHALKKYLEIIRSKQIGCAYLDSEWMDYLSSNPNITADFVTFANKANTEYGLMPKTVRLYGQTVLMYLRECEIDIPDRDFRRIKRCLPSNHPISREAELDANKIRTLLKHSDLKMKAILTIAVSSGMRIGEILKFKTSDINFETTPVEIFLSGEITKTKQPRRVFISSQAAGYLKRWLTESDALSSDGICFPYSASTEITRLKKLLKKCDLYDKDTRTGRTTIHFHLFRKFFLTEFKLVASAEAAEELAGHKGYLDESYRRLTQKQLREEYLKAETRLTIYPVEDTGNTISDELCHKPAPNSCALRNRCASHNPCDMQIQFDTSHNTCNIVHNEMNCAPVISDNITIKNQFLKLEKQLSKIELEIKQLNNAYNQNNRKT